MMPVLTTKDSGKMEEIVARYHNLGEEIDTLKLVFKNILYIKVGLRQYAGCSRLGDSFKEQETLIKQRLAEIEDLLKGMGEEMKKLSTFMKEPPQGGIQ